MQQGDSSSSSAATWKISELKSYLAQRGIEHSHCVEKQELVELVLNNERSAQPIHPKSSSSSSSSNPKQEGTTSTEPPSPKDKKEESGKEGGEVLSKHDLLALAKAGKWEGFKEKTQHIHKLQTYQDVHGETFLHWAAASDNVEMLEYLIDVKHLYINHANFYAATPLYYAASTSSANAVAFFIARCAEPREASSFSGKTPAQVCTDPKLREILVAYTARFESLILTRPFPNYRYRVADHWRTSTKLLLHPNGKGFYQGYPCHPMARVHFQMTLEEKGREAAVKKLLNICKKQDAKFEAYLRLAPGDDGSGTLERMGGCLICDSNVDEDEDRCPICGLVPMCSECVINPDPIVSQYREIHMNNCKRGIFSSSKKRV